MQRKDKRNQSDSLGLHRIVRIELRSFDAYLKIYRNSMEHKKQMALGVTLKDSFVRIRHISKEMCRIFVGHENDIIVFIFFPEGHLI